nr:hypothetical protein [Tanacetum cinerariifolium]
AGQGVAVKLLPSVVFQTRESINATFQAVLRGHGNPAGTGCMVGIRSRRQCRPAASPVDRGGAGRAGSLPVLRQCGRECFRTAQLERILAQA